MGQGPAGTRSSRMTELPEKRTCRMEATAYPRGKGLTVFPKGYLKRENCNARALHCSLNADPTMSWTLLDAS